MGPSITTSIAGGAVGWKPISNGAVGASIGADYLLYASKEKENGDVVYRIYSGHPTDRQLMSLDGKTIGNPTVMMSSLEAGPDTYDARRRAYEAIKD